MDIEPGANGTVENERPASRLAVFAGVVIAIIAALIVSYFLFWQSAPIDPISKAFSDSAKYRAMGEFDKANAYLEEIANATDNPQVKAKAETLIASNNFQTFDTKTQLESIKQLKNVLGEPSLTDWRRASALNTLIGFYYYGRDPVIAREIFSGNPYSSYLEDAGGDIGLAIRKLAEYSDSVFPMASTKLRIATWYSGELLDNKNLNEKTKKEYGDKVMSLIKESDILFPEEIKRNAPVTNLFKAIFWHFRAYNLAALYSAGLSKTPDDFEQSFQEVFNLDQSKLGAANRTMHEFTAYTHFYYGGFLSEIFGTSRADDIRLHAEMATEMVTSATEPSKVPFHDFMIIERDKPLTERDHNNRFFVALASVSTTFAEYLSQNGWKL